MKRELLFHPHLMCFDRFNAYMQFSRCKLILVIHTDEVLLQSFELFPILDASHFARLRNIDEAYLICSYEPTLSDDENPYPYRRLNLDGPTTGFSARGRHSRFGNTSLTGD
jgi:hypothetical protein